MRYVVGLMVIVFLAGGCSLVVYGIRWFMRRRQMVARMETAVGTILSVHKERRLHQQARPRRHQPSKVQILNYPVIQFHLPDGQAAEFRSQTGDMGTPSRFRPGMRINVLYDPLGKEVPLVKSRFGVYAGPLSTMIAGMAFICGAGMMWVAFGARIIGHQ